MNRILNKALFSSTRAFLFSKTAGNNHSKSANLILESTGIQWMKRAGFATVPSSNPSLSSTSTGSKEKEEIDTEMESKLAAFASRAGLGEIVDFSVLLDAVTHVSSPKRTEQSARNNLIGKKVLDFYVTQYVMAKYPHLPAPVCSTMVDAYIGQKSLADIGKSCGVQFVMRWKNSTKEDPSSDTTGPASVRSWAIESIVGTLYKNQGSQAALKFINSQVLTRSVNTKFQYDSYAKVNFPRQLLSSLLKSQSKTRPVARLLKESGRQSGSAVFIVGMYSGSEKISEGYGSSLKMAETRAARNALLEYYTQELKDVNIPADAIMEREVSFFEDRDLNEQARKLD